MVRITREELLKLAKAAQLEIPEAQMPVLVERLESVLSYASYLTKIAPEGNESEQPVSSQMSLNVREDVLVEAPVEPVLALAPDREENYYVVPVILKQ